MSLQTQAPGVAIMPWVNVKPLNAVFVDGRRVFTVFFYIHIKHFGWASAASSLSQDNVYQALLVLWAISQPLEIS